MSFCSNICSNVFRIPSYMDEQFSLSDRVGFTALGIETLCRIPCYIGYIGLGLVGCLTGGIRARAGNCFQKCSIDTLVSTLYQSVFGVLYPDVASGIDTEQESFAEEMIIRPLIKSAEDSSRVEDPCFQGQIVSRGKFARAALASVVSRVGEALIGTIAALYSLIPFVPKKQEAADFAFRELQITGVFQDVIFCATRIINPQAQVYYK